MNIYKYIKLYHFLLFPLVIKHHTTPLPCAYIGELGFYIKIRMDKLNYFFKIFDSLVKTDC